MKQVFFIVCFLGFTVLFSSCATTQTVNKKETEVAGYNLKSKKEQMQNKILQNKNKTLLATP
jgi:high-affinity K+ transport system ATPase subunit B